MPNVRYLRKDGKVIADFSYRKEALWKEDWVPSQETIHEGTVPVKILAFTEKPATVFYNGTISTASVTMAIEYDNESIQFKHPTSIDCDTSTLGEVTATAHYSTLSKDFKITVVAPALVSISVAGMPTTFSVGDTFSYEGMVVTGHFEDETTQIFTEGIVVDSSQVNMSVAGTYTVTVTCREKSTTYDITVQ